MHPYLARLGMQFNTFLNLAICLECSSAIGSKNIEAHLHEIHREHSFRINHVKLNQALLDLKVQESFDVTTLPSNCPQIDGLSLSLDAYLCSICNHIRGNLVSIKKHHYDMHKRVLMPTSWTRVAAQQLHHQACTPYFQVVPRQVIANKDDAMTRFFLSLNTKRQKMVDDFDVSKIDPRQVSTWLNATKWHILVARYDYHHLISLVAIPTKLETEFTILAEAVHTYTRKAEQMIDTLSNLALCIINSPEPP